MTDLSRYARHSIGADDIDAVSFQMTRSTLTGGEMVERFEEALAEKVGAKYAVVCSSGTAALHLAMMAIDVCPNDAVIVPANTFVATANAVRYCGGEVAFSDIDPTTGLMTKWNMLSASVNAHKGIKAVIPVHFAGQMCEMFGINHSAKSRGWYVIEDACHAIGAKYGGQDGYGNYKVGGCAHSDMTVFSFHPSKTITMGEGGAVTTNNRSFYNKMKKLRNHGLNSYWVMNSIGYNYRASEINCALGLSQLGKLDTFVEKRRQLVKTYDDYISLFLPKEIVPLERMGFQAPAWHLYVVQMDNKIRKRVRDYLTNSGIGTQLHYRPVCDQTPYINRYGNVLCEDAHLYASRALSLPLFANMTTDDVVRVGTLLHEAIRETENG